MANFAGDQVARLNEEVSLAEKSCLTNRWAYDAVPVGLTELTLLGSPGFNVLSVRYALTRHSGGAHILR